jgi:hypothetical protein
MSLLPDFGTYLVDHNILAPFTLRVFGDLILGKDQFLGWAISGSTSQSSVSSLGSDLKETRNPQQFFSPLAIAIGIFPIPLDHLQYG